jgi:predicted AlkP superfamily pyrophosphatase or phosphodiesterase
MTPRPVPARLVLALAILLGGWIAAAQDPARPLLILVSLDGWRWDYLDKVKAPNLRGLAARGIRAEGLIPSFPTLTFPNHYTIVTGLAPDHHGIVSNTMVDRSIIPSRFTMSSDTAKNPVWWGGEPIWTTAIKHGLRSASMFWPGSEAVRPTYVKPYDGTVPNAERVTQVLAWLQLPQAERPSFITLYFSDVDTASHDTGPESAETFAAAARLDDMIGSLLTGLSRLGLADLATIVVVSDHGLAQTSIHRVVLLDDYVDRREVEAVDLGAVVSLNPASTTTANAVYRKLAGKHPALAVYKKEQLPQWLRYGTHPRVPAIVGLVDAGWTVTWRETAAGWQTKGRQLGGAHGYDPRYRDMQGLFIAAGPGVRRGVVAPAIENIHLYNFMCELLGLTPAANDGDREQTRALLSRN